MADQWVERKDPKSGKTYYCNKATKKSQWTRPAEMGPADGASSRSTSKSKAPLGEAEKKAASADKANWKQRKDEKSGKMYYYNKVTKESTWQIPACLAGDESVQSDWREVTDPSSGRTYWYDKVHKTRTWYNPHTKKEDGKDGKTVSGAKPAADKPAAAAAAKPATETQAATATKATNDVDEQAQKQMMKMKINMQKEEEEVMQEEEEDEDGEVQHFAFAKHRHGWLNRKLRIGDYRDDASLMTFKKSMIKKALLKKNRDLDVEAVQSFKNVMSYMGDRKSSKQPLDHAKKLLRNIMVLPIGIRDELYMQICKQTTQNPRPNSAIKGWELMVFCVATFPPSKKLKSYLVDFIKRTIQEKINPKITQLAEIAQANLPKIILMGQRKQVPSKQELECLIDNKPVAIRVSLCNETYKTLEINSYTLVSQVEEELVQKYNLTCSMPFALYEQAEPNVERILDGEDRMLDVLASWENRKFNEELVQEEKQSQRKTKFDKHKDAGKKIKKVEIEYKNFLYKAKLVLKTDNAQIMADQEAVSLIYIQATQDVVTARYPIHEKDITVLAALQLQATFGDYSSEKVPGWLSPKITEYIPRHLISDNKGNLRNDMVKEWETKILAKYEKIKGFTALDAKLNYLDYVQEWTFYGATFFTVEQRQFKDYPSPLTLGINCEGVLLMHPEKKTVLENYQFTDIVTWGHSDEKFIVVVGNILQQRKLIFKTGEGKHMNHLIHDYVKFKVQTSTVPK